jgi:chromosome segregation ATPase
MASQHDGPFDANKPGLVLLYGNTSKKYRYLDRDVLVIGRARGCDMGLDAPDVSSLHCVISRAGTGFAIRDCQSRSGTKINGNPIREAVLHDGDLLQLGPFSFRVNLPLGCSAPAARSSRLHHLERSRRNFARIAMRLRKLVTLKEVPAPTVADSQLALSQLSKQASGLKLRLREYDQRLHALENAERDLSRDRDALARDRALLEERRKEAEALTGQLDQRQRDLQAQDQRLEKRAQKLDALERNWTPRLKEHESRCREMESQQLNLVENGRKVEQRAAELENQRKELDSLRRRQEKQQQDIEKHLQELKVHEEQLRKQQSDLEAQAKILDQQKKEFPMRDSLAGTSAVIVRLGQQKAALAGAEESLREQRQQLDDLLASLQEAGPPVESVDAGELERLREENEKLRHGAAARSGVPDEKLRQLKKENEELKQLVAVLEQGQSLQPSAGTQDEAGEVQRLRRLLAEKQAELDEFNRQAEEALGHTEMGFVEAQLVEYRRQLETDRQKLNREVEQLRMRNQEMDEAIREMELEMSRERAELGRERQRLERMREDVRLEQERLQREAGMRERLAPVKNLREEITGKRQSVNDQTPRPAR